MIGALAGIWIVCIGSLMVSYTALRTSKVNRKIAQDNQRMATEIHIAAQEVYDQTCALTSTAGRQP